jgi:chromosome segregation ATPase
MTYRLKALSAETTKFIEEKQALEAWLKVVSSEKEKAEKDANDHRAKAQAAEQEKEQKVAELADTRIKIAPLTIACTQLRGKLGDGLQVSEIHT